LMGSAFEGFSQAELLAYTYRTYGERGLREVLNRVRRSDKEALIDHSAELRLVGMAEAAAIIDEYIPAAVSRFDQIHCPYGLDDRAGHADFRARNDKAKAAWEAKRDSPLGLVIASGASETKEKAPSDEPGASER
jgi:hypothetical protein